MINDICNTIKKLLETTRLPFEIIGVIVFGSRVKGKATLHSDIDLLIVAEGINPRRQRRGNEVLLLKKCLPGLPFDILLLSCEEVISNFKNHNPLFLDITEDGIIIADKSHFLEDLMRETHKYIEEKGILRLKDGWKFPVKHGIATYLSGISNKDFAIAMLKDGDRDYLAGNTLAGEGFYDKAVYHYQQSVEKCIKSILIAFGIFQKTHLVGGILIEVLPEKDISASWKQKLHEIAEISETIEPEVSLSRYPGIIDNNLWIPLEEYERKDAEKAKEKSDRVLSVTKDFLIYWFSA